MFKTGENIIKINKKAMVEVKRERKVMSQHKSLQLESIMLFFIAIFIVIYVAITVLPILSIIRVADFKDFGKTITNRQNIDVILLSLSTGILSSIFIFLLATPVVYYLTFKKSFLSKILDVFVSIPTVLPPAVAGIGLLLAFGRQGILGGVLSRFGIVISFTPLAVIIAQFFVASAFYIKIFKAGVESIAPEVLEASYVFGAGKIETFIKMVVPMLKKNIASGLLVSWARAMGEFGATITFAGNVMGRTRTIPLQIYTYMQTDIKSAALLSVVMFIISFVVLYFTKVCLKTEEI
ncbi:ABC transporter permease [Herbivorax sp. ANBcel31]|uniref:ABC transporter permease n=1 Tax=Herbivorax sp. ANBcel31 TaxID=3069754 RepID=UPI0027B7D875|nr:ABC transporter permease [Herbivorax sp. ANBcel31]MDQ2087101.1 ABC transporter permease [Herbivorax sp. ANBcel31]